MRVLREKRGMAAQAAPRWEKVATVQPCVLGGVEGWAKG